MDFSQFKNEYLAAEDRAPLRAQFPMWASLIDAMEAPRHKAAASSAEVITDKKSEPAPLVIIASAPQPEPAPAKPEPLKTTALVAELKEAGQDFEFYPTTPEIIAAIHRDLSKIHHMAQGRHYNPKTFESILDVGAGNGATLAALAEWKVKPYHGDKPFSPLEKLYAIEKSPILCGQLPASVFVIGTEFMEQSLITKKVDVIFSNPPYSAFDQWAVKIIRESAAPTVYLVIPERWKDSNTIADALKFRDATAQDLGSFDFLEADRKARAKVSLLRITYKEESADPFARFFAEQFADLIGKFKAPAESKPRAAKKFDSLVVGESYPDAMVALYNQEMAHIQRNYAAAGELDAELLRELAIDPAKIMECLKNRLSGLRLTYWSELFNQMQSITRRLTSKTRQKLLNQLGAHVHVDFTVANIHAVIVWAIKNANQFIDSQLVETYEYMINKANVINYTSNKRVFTDNRWRYLQGETDNSHFSLDYRIVMHSCGGICGSSYRAMNGLDERATDFIGDLLTCANNLGFTCNRQPSQLQRGVMTWASNERQEFYFIDTKGQRRLLFDVRAFQNGNLHVRFDKAFILALNVEHGRLKGWIRSGAEAAQEMRDPAAAKHFKANLQLPAGNPLLQLCA